MNQRKSSCTDEECIKLLKKPHKNGYYSLQSEKVMWERELETQRQMQRIKKSKYIRRYISIEPESAWWEEREREKVIRTNAELIPITKSMYCWRTLMRSKDQYLWNIHVKYNRKQFILTAMVKQTSTIKWKRSNEKMNNGVYKKDIELCTKNCVPCF